MPLREFVFESQKEKGLVSVDLKDNFIFKGDETLTILALFNVLKNSLYYKAKLIFSWTLKNSYISQMMALALLPINQN